MHPIVELVRNTKGRLPMPVVVYPGAALVGRKVIDVATDPAAQVEVSEALRLKLGLELRQSAMDLSAEAFGATARMADDEVPTVLGRLVTDAASIDKLVVPTPGDKRTKVYIEAARKLASQPGKPFTVGGCIGPFTLAGRLFGVSESLEFAIEEPEATEVLINKATDFLVGYLREFKKAGCKAVFVAEPTAGLLSPKMLGRFSTPFVKRIVDSVCDDNFGIILHNCGAKVAHIPNILATGAQVFHFGKPMDMPAALAQVPSDVVLCGNFDPSGVFVGESAASITAQVEAMGASCAAFRNWVPSSGCDIPPNAPIANIEAFVAAVKRL